jgi:hypothetical protein
MSANQVTLGELAGRQKLERLATVAERVKRLEVSLDDVGVARSLPESVEVLSGVDTGQHRIGTLPGGPTAKGMRELVKASDAGRFPLRSSRRHHRDAPRYLYLWRREPSHVGNRALEDCVAVNAKASGTPSP